MLKPGKGMNIVEHRSEEPDVICERKSLFPVYDLLLVKLIVSTEGPRGHKNNPNYVAIEMASVLHIRRDAQILRPVLNERLVCPHGWKDATADYLGRLHDAGSASRSHGLDKPMSQ